MNLLKSYFNLQIKQRLLKIKTKPMAPRFRRLSTKRVFIGKGELKHTSSRVIITFYVYNTEGMFLSHKIMQLKNGIFYIPNYVNLKKTVTKDHEGNIKISYNNHLILKNLNVPVNFMKSIFPIWSIIVKILYYPSKRN